MPTLLYPTIGSTTQTFSQVRGAYTEGDSDPFYRQGTDSVTSARREDLLDTMKEVLADPLSVFRGDGSYRCDAYIQARNVARALPRTARLPEPDIDPDGMFSFGWWDGNDHVFALSVSDVGRLFYAGQLNGEPVKGTAYFADALPQPLAQLIAVHFPS